MRKRWWLLIIIIALALFAFGAFIFWALAGPEATAEAQAALNSNEVVEVEDDDWLVFQPAGIEPSTGFIFYPGGRVDPAAYAPLAQEIAAEGYLVVIVPMPLNFAFLAPNSALEVMNAFPEITHWAVGGHSLGGAMAANFTSNHPNNVDGLVLWAAYPAAADDLSALDLAATSIYGTNDGLTSLEDIENSRSLLPPDTRWVEISGGNHAQFGSYGPQSGDNPATISAAEQQAQIVQATLALLDELAQ